MKYQSISLAEAKQKLNYKGVLLIDVREEYEWDDHNIGGINIPLAELSNRKSELQDYNEIIICCKSGARSKAAAHHLQDQLPHTQIYTIKDGIN